MGWLAGAFSVLSKVVTGIFGVKKSQADAVRSAVESISSATKADEAYAIAVGHSIAALYENGSWLERNWRPVSMWIFLGLITARLFGMVPPGLSPEEVANVYRFFEIGLIGYLPLRSVDKWMKGFQIGNLLKEFIKKKVL